MNNDLQIIPTNLLEAYCLQVHDSIEVKFNTLKDAIISTDNFSFYTSVSSVFSSKIEGEEIELDSYVKHKRYGIAFNPDYTKKIDDLYDAYVFAKENNISKQHIEKVHTLLTKNILHKTQQGKHRKQNMYVTSKDGNIEYVACNPFEVEHEMNLFYHDLAILCNATLTVKEVFYFASMLHLVLVKIHPFNDGNGRTSRVLEKWFLAHHLKEKAWYIQSEKNYYLQHQTYYSHLRLLGLEYEQLDYTKAMPFILLLPQSLNL